MGGKRLKHKWFGWVLCLKLSRYLTDVERVSWGWFQVATRSLDLDGGREGYRVGLNRVRC